MAKKFIFLSLANPIRKKQGIKLLLPYKKKSNNNQ